MKLTEAEWHLMTALWERHPATARELADSLPDEIQWAYTTVKTLLSRLVAKKAVSERKLGNVAVYEPLLTRSRARRSALRTLLDQAFGGAVAPLLDFLADDRGLSRRQRRELMQLLEKEKASKKE